MERDVWYGSDVEMVIYSLQAGDNVTPWKRDQIIGYLNDYLALRREVKANAVSS